jgi:hypothetical protein
MLRNDEDDVDVFRAGGWTREALVAMDRAFVEAVRASLTARGKAAGELFEAGRHLRLKSPEMAR